jgi:hypothetical protein
MKKLILTSILALLVAAGASAIPQDYPEEYLGLPGDNLNLYAVMKLFQESETLEGFERNVNSENSRINNLDLNGDNLIDYITVHDYVDGDVHSIVLRVALNRNEFQDVAVFTVQKFRDGSAQIQLVGDEELYGSNYIIEPIYDETPNPGYTGSPSQRATVTVVRTTPYEVALWPVVRYIYLPNYVIWRSSWYWGYYPSYWNPWRPYYWHYYYGYHYNWYHHYYNHYRHWDHYRYARYNDYYYRTVRAHSPYVSQRIREGQYRNTYSRPEQRREGEALFTKANPNQSRRTADNTPVIRERRTSIQNGSERNSEGTVRRQTTTGSQRPAARSASETNTGNTRRSAPAASERPESRSSSQQNANTERKSAPAVSNRPETRSSSQQNAPAVRKESSSASERSASRPSQSARSQSSGGSRQPAASTRSSQSRNTRENKPAQASKRTEERKESKSSSSRRK